MKIQINLYALAPLPIVPFGISV